MKKWVALVLAAVLAMTQAFALAEDLTEAVPVPQTPPAYDHLVVGSTTAFSGHFATGLWGNNTADLDVKELLSGYNLIRWEQEQGLFTVDPTVVTGILVYDDEQGNRTYTMVLSDDLRYSDGTMPSLCCCPWRRRWRKLAATPMAMPACWGWRTINPARHRPWLACG